MGFSSQLNLTSTTGNKTMRSFLNTVRSLTVASTFAIVSAITATGAFAGPINVNSSINTKATVNATTNVTGANTSQTGSLVDRGAQTTNKVVVGANQSQVGSGVNNSSNVNSAVTSNKTVTIGGNASAFTGSTVKTVVITDKKLNVDIIQTSRSAVNDSSDINASVNSVKTVKAEGLTSASGGSTAERGVGVNTIIRANSNQDSVNPVNQAGSNLNYGADSSHVVGISNDIDAVNGGKVNSQTVSNHDVLFDVKQNR
jgi:hypothetical protein